MGKKIIFMAKKEFKLRCKLIFSGEFTVMAHSKQEAEQLIKDNCCCSLGQLPKVSDDNLRWDLKNLGKIVLNKDYGKEEESEQ